MRGKFLKWGAMFVILLSAAVVIRILTDTLN